MCGIAGIYSFGSGIAQQTLVRFTDSLSHRGPDGAGYELLNDAKVGLGHRRLSILDVSPAGKQPMSYAEGRYWITFNGEIYNFLELRKLLSLKGYSFKTDSDTEVILAAFDCWGPSCLHQFNGMWALAIYDAKNRSLFLARDRFGVKPLHYTFFNKSFAFASETRAFSYLDGFSKVHSERLLGIAIDDPDRVEGSGYTIYKDIYQLLPGHCMTVSPETSKPEQTKWWETKEHMTPVSKSYEKQKAEFFDLFRDACKLRLRSDVPLASALSGGMDSSSIFCTINHLLKSGDSLERAPENIQKAFVAYYPGTPNDEKAYAEEVIKFTGGSAVYVETDYSNLTTELIQTTKLFDSIAGTPIMCATDVYKAMRSNGYKVSLDGHGADEMLYGYKQMVFDAYESAVLRHKRHYASDMLDTYSRLFPVNRQTAAYESLAKYGNSISSPVIKTLLKDFKAVFFGNGAGKAISSSVAEPFVAERSKYLAPLSLKHASQYYGGDCEQKCFNLFHYTSLPVNLRDFDRASMQNGIEIRSPFMDWRLVTFTFSLPTQSKVGAGYTKRILRDAMKGLMPEDVRTRTLKIGLSAPLVSWFNGPLKEFVRDKVNSSDFLESPVWNGKAVRDYVESKESAGWSEFSECSRVWKFINAKLLLERV